MKKLRILMLGLLMLSMFSGCQSVQNDSQRGKDWDYTVVPSADIPEDLAGEIEQKKINSFQMTYEDGIWMYIAIGYGEQESGGYSIQVQGLYEKGEDLCVETTLTGPAEDDVHSDKTSYPYLVIKTEKTDKNVVFSQ